MLSRNEIKRMIKEQISRTLFRPTDTFEPNGALAGDVIVAPLGGITKTPLGISAESGAGLEAGAQVAFGDAGPRSGWLICDGSAVSRITYAILFAQIGVTYGAGDGSTTFNVPDLRGVSPIGVS